MSGWQDSNLRPPAPKAGAIPGYATLFHLFFDTANIVGALVFLILSLLLVYGYKDRLKEYLRF
jgi:hypothetical protein